MELKDMTNKQLFQLIDDAKTHNHMSDLLRMAISAKFKLPIEKVSLIDMVALGWDVAEELKNRLLKTN